MPKKVLIALPPVMLEQVDFIASCEHRTRSDLIREALRRYIGNFVRASGPALPAPVVENFAPPVKAAPIAAPIAAPNPEPALPAVACGGNGTEGFLTYNPKPKYEFPAARSVEFEKVEATIEPPKELPVLVPVDFKAYEAPDNVQDWRQPINTGGEGYASQNSTSGYYL